MLRKLVSTLLISVLSGVCIVACTSSILTPPVGPGTDYPCGLQGKSCGNHMCCWRDQDCGGGNFNGCPKDYCCFNGGDDALTLRCPEHQMLDGDMLNGKFVREACK